MEAGGGDESAADGGADAAMLAGGDGTGAGGGSSAREQLSAEASRMESQRGGRASNTSGDLVQVSVGWYPRKPRREGGSRGAPCGRAVLPLGADEVTEDGRRPRWPQDFAHTVGHGFGLRQRGAFWGLPMSVRVALVNHER